MLVIAPKAGLLMHLLRSQALREARRSGNSDSEFRRRRHGLVAAYRLSVVHGFRPETPYLHLLSGLSLTLSFKSLLFCNSISLLAKPLEIGSLLCALVGQQLKWFYVNCRHMQQATTAN